MKLIDLGSGKCSWFGGPLDTGVGASEGLSCIEMEDLQQWWYRRIFLPQDLWKVNYGLARNLNSNAFFCAMRWGYADFGGVQGEILQGFTRQDIREAVFVVSANGKSIICQAADWGPNTDTGRLIDLSKGALTYLDLATDDIVEVQALC